MSTLDVKISGLDSSFQWERVPVALTIRDKRLRVVAQHSLRGQGSYKLQRGNTYFVSAELPSGETLDVEVTMPESGKTLKVMLEARQSPREWLAESLFLGTATPTKWHGESQSPLVRPVYSVEEHLALADLNARTLDAPPTPATFEDTIQSIHYSLWVYERGSTWQPDIGIRHTFTQHDTTAATFNLRLLEENLYALQIGGARMRARTVILPPASPTREEWHETKVLLRPSHLPSFFNDGVAVKVTSPNTEVEALAHYLLLGDSYGAGAVSNEIIVSAKKLVRDKRTDPNGAAIGAYYLLKVQKYRQLGEWLQNFANWFPWLPDASILYATRLLRYRNPDWSQVREYLLLGAAAGLPVYSKGLQLLIDGLETLRERAAIKLESNDDVEAALRSVRRYASCVDWTQLLTTFVSDTPSTPTLEAKRRAPVTNAVAVLQ